MPPPPNRAAIGGPDGERRAFFWSPGFGVGARDEQWDRLPGVFLGDSYGPKPYKFIGFGDSYGPKPYKFIGFGDSYGPKPYKFIGFFGGRFGAPQHHRCQCTGGSGPVGGACGAPGRAGAALTAVLATSWSPKSAPKNPMNL